MIGLNQSRNQVLIPCKFLAHFLRTYISVMLTRREIMVELQQMGILEMRLLKFHCRKFEKYMAVHYGSTRAAQKEFYSPPFYAIQSEKRKAVSCIMKERGIPEQEEFR